MAFISLGTLADLSSSGSFRHKVHHHDWKGKPEFMAPTSGNKSAGRSRSPQNHKEGEEHDTDLDRRSQGLSHRRQQKERTMPKQSSGSRNPTDGGDLPSGSVAHHVDEEPGRSTPQQDLGPVSTTSRSAGHSSSKRDIQDPTAAD